ncbi:MAG: cyclic nucleotide-binding domain-containing protein [Candidatus Sericytochromatia bacterium]
MHLPQEGQHKQIRAGQFLLSGAQGPAEQIHPAYLLAGQVAYTCKSSTGSVVEILLGPGSLIGLECLYTNRYPVFALAKTPVEWVEWDPQTFELYLGKDIEFAVAAITSLSHHQRRVDAELSFRVRHQQERIHDAATVLYLLGQENFHGGMFDVAEAYFERIRHSYPQSPYCESAEGYLVQIQRKKPQGSQFKLSSEASSLGIDTQYGLYNLAFYGVSAISQDIYQRFGKAFAAGEILFREGDEGDELFLILEGSVEVYRADHTLSYLTEGDIFGEMAMFEGKPRSATIKALEPLKVLALTQEHFRMIFQLHPSWTLQLIRGFAVRIANCYDLLSRS